MRELAGHLGVSENAILDQYAIDRTVYYMRAEPVYASSRSSETKEDAGPNRMRKKPVRVKRAAVEKMEPTEKLALLNKIRSDYSSPNRAIACENAGLDVRTFRYLEINEPQWKKELFETRQELLKEQKDAEERKKERRKQLPRHRQKVLADAVELLHASGMSFQEATETFDRTHASYYQWRKGHTDISLVREEEQESKPRTPEEKVRIVYAIRAINQRMKRKIRICLSGAGISSVAAYNWQHKIRTMETYIHQLKDAGDALDQHRGLARRVLSGRARIRQDKLAPWLQKICELQGDDQLTDRVNLLLEEEQDDSPSSAAPAGQPEQAVRQSPSGMQIPREYLSCDDENLVQRAQNGDECATGALWQRYEQHLRVRLVSMLRDEHAAEDALQNLFLTVRRKIGSVHEPKKVRYWLDTAARRAALNVMQRGQRERPTDEFYTPDPRCLTPDRILEHGEQLEARHHRGRQVHAALEQMKPLDARMLRLFYFEDLSLNEIASLVDAPVGTIKRRLHTARHRLRAHMEEAGIDHLFEEIPDTADAL